MPPLKQITLAVMCETTRTQNGVARFLERNEQSGLRKQEGGTWATTTTTLAYLRKAPKKTQLGMSHSTFRFRSDTTISVLADIEYQ